MAADTQKTIQEQILDQIQGSVGDVSNDINDTLYAEASNQSPILWKNNETRLNQSNMNAITRYILGYTNWAGSQTAKFVFNNLLYPLVAYSSGWSNEDKIKNPTAGEIFNDYENNKANGDYSSAFGTNTIADGNFQFVIGKFNDPADIESPLVVGFGQSDQDRQNIFKVTSDGNAQITGIPTQDNDLIPKRVLDEELSRVKQLNQWIGRITVTSAQYDLANNNAALQTILTDKVKDLAPSGRTDPRNGDLITVHISDPAPTDPQYDTIWIFIETDPTDPNAHDGKWEFYSSQQQLLNASKDVKGLVQIGNNISVNEGLISVSVASKSVLGVVKIGDGIEIDASGTISSSLNWIEY